MLIDDKMLIVIAGGLVLYLKWKDQILWWLSDPTRLILSVFGLAAVTTVYFLFGHVTERIWGKITAIQKGIRPEKHKQVTFPFKPSNLSSMLDLHGAKDSTYLGMSAEKKKPVLIPDIRRTQHLQVVGMTGTGKTESVFMPLVYQDAVKNRPIIIIDAKGEIGPIERLHALLKGVGRADDFLLFSLTHKHLSSTYNPLFVGESDPQVVIDAFLSNYHDDNSFFRETARTIFTNTFYILHSFGKPFTPMDVYTYLTNETAFKEINKKAEKNKDAKLYLTILRQLIETMTLQYKGWRHIMTGFNNYLLSYKDDILNDPDSDIILTDIIRDKKIVYFQLPTNAYPIQAVNIARIVQANLRYISSLIQTGALKTDDLISVIIDEYGSFAEETFIEVLNKARSSRMMVTLAHQSLSDLTAISPEFMKRVDENTLNKIYFKQTDPELCELIAKSFGTFEKTEKTYRMEGGRFGNQKYLGDTSNRTVHEFNFHPDRIKNLHQFGQGYYIYKANMKESNCINFGLFDEIKGLPYAQKSKSTKSAPLNLFNFHYISIETPPETPQSATPQSQTAANSLFID